MENKTVQYVVGTLVTIIISLIVYIFVALSSTVEANTESLNALRIEITTAEHADDITINNIINRVERLEEEHE